MGGVVKTNKHVQFSPELEIPLSCMSFFPFSHGQGRESILPRSVQISWYHPPKNDPRPQDDTRSMDCSHRDHGTFVS